MARLQTLLLPNGDFAFILDEFDGNALPWANFAETCGARNILITDDTIRILELFAESPTGPLSTPAPQTDDSQKIGIADLDDAPEAIQRLIGFAFGHGRFAHLHGKCGDGCDCGTGDQPATDNPPPAEMEEAAEAEPRRWRDQAGHLWIYLSTSTVQLCDEAGKPIRAELRAREYVEQQYGPLTIVEAEPFAATAWPVDHAIAETFKQSQLVVPHIAAPTTPELTADPTADAVRAQVLGTDPLFGDVTVPLTKGVGGPQIGTATVTPDGKMTGTLGEAVDATTLQRLMDDAPYSADWAAAKAGRQCGAMNSAGRPCALRHDHPYLHEFEPAAKP